MQIHFLNSNFMKVIAVLPPGLEEEGFKEIDELGGSRIKQLRRCVSFEGDVACLFRMHLQARLPFRLLREISRFQCENSTQLYQGVQQALDWQSWLNPNMSFCVHVSGSTYGLSHSHYSALQVKNAVVDMQRNFFGERSNINLENPDLCLHLHLSNQGAVLSLDGSASSLHRRGYRSALGKAPLKENIAAGLIRMTGWDGSSPLVDPLCGSGTFLIEAASLLMRIPPGLNRSFILENWLDFDFNLWEAEKLIAQKKIDLNILSSIKIIGCEQDPEIAKQARRNITSAGLSQVITIENSHFQHISFPQDIGTIVCNPPYGKRIGYDQDLEALYRELGEFLKRNASSWNLWILSGNPTLTRYLKMRANKKFPLSNGGIDCRWLNYLIN